MKAALLERFACHLFMRATGKTKDELLTDWSVNYFMTRSRWRAYWLTFRGN